MCLKTLRKIIERENKNIDVVENHTPCYEWEPEEYEYYKDEIIERQHSLCNLKCIEALGKLIS